MKKIFFSLIILVCIWGVSAFFLSEKNDKQTQERKKIHITTSIIPLASVANFIGEEYVEIFNIIPAGVSPHGFDINPNQIVKIKNSDLIIEVGSDHIDGFLENAFEEKRKIIFNKILGIEHEDEELHEKEYEHEEDPHVWMSPLNVKKIAKEMREEFSKIQPEYAEIFQKNYETFSKEIDTVIEDFEKNTAGKKQGYFIVFHDAYDYLFEEININIEKKIIFQSNILQSQNISEMKNFIDTIEKNNIQYFFKEPQFTNSSLKILLEKNDVIISELDPLGTDEGKNGYINNLISNLNSLEKIYE